jgi:glutamate formiminotransferase / 5-formyltetrahydrofolate cyclo-ligase
MPGGELLLGVPNFSEGADERIVRALAATAGAAGELLDLHFDRAHNRCVVTVAGSPGALGEALFDAAEQAIDLIDISRQEGLHPRIGSIDVCPVVYPRDELRDSAAETALALAERIGAELELPVFLYGELATTGDRQARAYFRTGGPEELVRRMASGELAPDFGPSEPHPKGGATLITARRPLVAFNLELDTPNLETAREVAAQLRETGGGLPAVRAIGLPWAGGRTQVSINVEDPERVPLAAVVERTRRLAEVHGASVVGAELVGLAPEAALVDYPASPAIEGFDPDAQIIERRLGPTL